ncbi:MAG: Hydroxyproline-rich glyco family [Trebouxia sp. A1-2]|nr:MAG: Hydroxyproline-rich glyco family [Trebouxia sp. A1-2]
MAFSFGTPSGSAFGATSGGFGQSSTPAVGAASTPVFAQSSAPFGASSGAFSFAAASTPAFGGQAGAFNFASASTPTFGASAPAFGVSAPAFGASAPSFGQLAPFAQPPQQQQQQQQNQLSTKNGQPISDSTPWDDINDPSKQVLLSLEKQIMEYRHQKQQVDACQRLQESQEAKEDMEAEHHSLAQILSVLANIVKSDSDSIDSFRERVMQLLHHTEVAVMTAQRAETWRQLSKKMQHGQPIDPAERDRLLRLPITLPSNYLRIAIQQFQETLQQYEQLVQSLERVVQPEEGLHPALRSQEGHEPPLKIILQNLYRYLMAVTANLDKLHEGVADARQAFLDKKKQGGDYSNCFEEADQRGLFSSAAAFGQSAGGSSLFGAPAQSAAVTGTLFGASQPASGGLFGIPQSAASTGSVFGSPQSVPAAGGLFGAAPGAIPAFGAAPGATPAFGAQQPASPFGGTAQSAAAFGQPIGGGGFGQQNAFNRQPTQPVNTRKTKSGRK